MVPPLSHPEQYVTGCSAGDPTALVYAASCTQGGICRASLFIVQVLSDAPGAKPHAFSAYLC